MVARNQWLVEMGLQARKIEPRCVRLARRFVANILDRHQSRRIHHHPSPNWKIQGSQQHGQELHQYFPLEYLWLLDPKTLSV